MDAGRLDSIGRYAGMFDARAADAHLEIEAPAARPPHEQRVRTLAPTLQAALQVAGRAVAARAQEGADAARSRTAAAAAGPPAHPEPAAAAVAASPATAASLQGVDGSRPHGGGPDAMRLEGAPGRPGAPVGGAQRAASDPGRSGAADASASGEPVAPALPAGAVAAPGLSVEAALRREYDTELAELKRKRSQRRVDLRSEMQHAVLRRDPSALRTLRELALQLDTDFNALEAALKQRISEAWVAQAPVSAQAPRPGARTPAEQREVNELLKALQKRRGEARQQFHATVRAACLRRDRGSLGLLAEWYRTIEDELLEQELNPVTTRQREALAQRAQAEDQRSRERLLLNQDIRAACETDPAGTLGLLAEVRHAIEAHHHGKLEALRSC
jgi:hypothetical protein